MQIITIINKKIKGISLWIGIVSEFWISLTTFDPTIDILFDCLFFKKKTNNNEFLRYILLFIKI